MRFNIVLGLLFVAYVCHAWLPFYYDPNKFIVIVYKQNEEAPVKCKIVSYSAELEDILSEKPIVIYQGTVLLTIQPLVIESHPVTVD